MAREPSGWDVTDLPDGRTLQDPVWSGGSSYAAISDLGHPQGVWLAAPMQRAAGIFIGVFLGVQVALCVVFFPQLLANPMVFFLFGALAGVAAYLASPKGFDSAYESMGWAWLYLPLPAPPKENVEMRIRQVLAAAKFTKIRFDPDEQFSAWYGDGAVKLTLECFRDHRGVDGTPGAVVPRAIYLETKGAEHRDLHRRLKGQLLYALDDRYAQHAQPLEEMKRARLADEHTKS